MTENTQITDTAELLEANFNSADIFNVAKVNLDFLAALALPKVFKYLFPSLYKLAWNWLTEYAVKTRDFSQLALGLPRGFSKTTLIKLFFIWCICYTNKKFLVICAETQTKSNNILADVCDMLSEPNIIAVYGHWKSNIETDRQDQKKFSFRGRSIILAATTVEAMRGLNLKNERPDVILFDDIQSRVMAESQQISETLEREMIGTAMKAKSPHGCLFIFVANMYPTKFSILKRLKTNPNWIKFIVGGILADGTSLWEELQPIKQLLREYQNDLAMGRPDIFFAEVLNDENASASNIIDLSLLPEFPEIDSSLHAGNFIIIDPSGDKATSDLHAIGYFEIHDTKPILIDIINARLSPGDCIRETIKLAFKHNCKLIAIESVAYQATLNYWFGIVCNQLGIIGLESVEIYPGGLSKNTRIMGMLRSYAGGDIFVHPDLKTLVHLEVTKFNPMKTNNEDNILDCLTYAPKVIEQYGAYIVSQTIVQLQDSLKAKVWETADNCCF